MAGPSLAVWGGGSTRGVRTRHDEGASVVAWSGAEADALAEAGVAFRTLEEVIGPEGMAGAEAAARSWARVWARLPLVEGRSFRDLVEWRGESLLWTTEGFLRTATAGPRCARTVDLCLRLLEALQPAEVDAYGLSDAEAALLARAATASGILFHGRRSSVGPLALPPPSGRAGPLRRMLSAVAPRRSPLLRGLKGPREVPLLLVVVAGPEDRALLRPLLDAAEDSGLRAVAVDAAHLAQLETRKVRRVIADGARLLRQRLSALRGTPALAASYVHRGIGFADLAGRDLEAVLLWRLPAAVRRLESALELFAAAQPELLAVALPERDERRTLGLAASLASIPWAALRLGAGEWDEPDRADGGPHPSASLALTPDQDPAAVLERLREAVPEAVAAR